MENKESHRARPILAERLREFATTLTANPAADDLVQLLLHIRLLLLSGKHAGTMLLHACAKLRDRELAAMAFDLVTAAVLDAQQLNLSYLNTQTESATQDDVVKCNPQAFCIGYAVDYRKETVESPPGYKEAFFFHDQDKHARFNAQNLYESCINDATCDRVNMGEVFSDGTVRYHSAARRTDLKTTITSNAAPELPEIVAEYSEPLT